MEQERLSNKSIFSYAAPGFASSATGLVQGAFLNKYYNDVFGVPLTTLATTIFIASILSLYFSVFIGYIGDHHRSKFGRRRPFIATLGPIKEIAFFLLLVPLHSGGETAHIIWFSIFYVIYNMGDEGAMVSVAALGVELTSDNQERARLYIWENGIGLSGVFFAAAISSALNSAMSQRKAYSVMGVAFASLGMLGFFLIVKFVKENTGYKREPIPFIPSLNRCLRNRVWVQYMKSVASLGVFNELTGLYAFAVQFIYDLNPDTYLAVLIIEYAIIQIMVLPLVYYIIGRKGKIFTFRVGVIVLIIYGLVSFFSTFSSIYIFMVSIALLAIGIAMCNVTAAICLSDCIDYDELLSGKRREATYQSVSGIPSEFFAVGGKSLPLIFLNVAGYIPINWKDHNTKHQPNSVIWVLRFFLGVVPFLLSIIAWYTFADYPVDEKMHEKVIEAVNEMHEKSHMYNDYGLSKSLDRSDDNYNNEALAKCVVDPITNVLVPVPKFSQPNVSQLQDQSSDIEDNHHTRSDQDGTEAPLLIGSSTSDNAPELVDDEWLLDYFTARELCLIQNWNPRILKQEITISSIFYFIIMCGLLIEGGYMAVNEMGYSAFCWLFIGSFTSVLFLIEYIRCEAIERVMLIPNSILKDIIREHRINIAKFRPSIQSEVSESGNSIEELVIKEDELWTKSFYYRYFKFITIRFVLFGIFIFGILRITFGFKEKTQ